MFLFSFFHISLFAPTLPNVICIPQSRGINYVESLIVRYKPLIEAVGIIESNCNNNAINESEGARGYFQIRKCRLEHYNKLTGKEYTMEDMHIFEKAREVFLYFINHDSRGRIIPDKSYEQVAKNWNGSGPKTEQYWAKVQSRLQLKRANV